MRISSINDELVKLGTEWFNSGRNLEDASEKYRNNDFFIKGFNDSKKNSCKK